MKFSPKAKIYFYNAPISMGCGLNRLAQIVKEELGKEPDSEDLYVFMNKRRNYLKIFYYHANGFCIFAKKLPTTFFVSDGLKGRLGVEDMTKLITHVTTKEKK